MTESAKARVWDLPVRVFHWALAGSFAGAYALSESERWRDVHAMLGYTVLGLIAFRICWGFIGTKHARFADFRYGPRAALRHLRDEVLGRARHYAGHNPAGSWAVYGLLLLGAATGITGYLTLNEIGGDSLEEVHEACANAWLFLVAAHVAGVVFSSVMQRENLARGMFTGRKRAAVDGREPPALAPLGLALAVAVLGFWTLGLSGSVPLPGMGGTGTGAGQRTELAEAHESDED